MIMIDAFSFFSVILPTFTILIGISNYIFKYSYSKIDLEKFKELKICVMVPARNKAANIGRLISDLSKQNYYNFEVLVYNDESTDETYNLAKTAIDSLHVGAIKYRLIKGISKPDGWSGKNFACHQMSLQACKNSDIYAFIDADTYPERDFLKSINAYMQEYNPGILSFMHRQITKTMGESMIVPLLNLFVYNFLPLFLIPHKNHYLFSLANGQMLAFSKDSYMAQGGHQSIKAETLDDIMFSHKIKLSGKKVLTIPSPTDLYFSCRMYSDFQSSFSGLRRSLALLFKKDIFGLAFVTTVYFFFLIFPLLVTIFNSNFWLPGALAFISYLIAIQMSKGNFLKDVLYYPLRLIVMVYFLISIFFKFYSVVDWKGRKY